MTGKRSLHPSGALWLPESKALLVADLHLGYSFAQRRRGQLGPIADTKTAGKLQAVLEEFLPKQLILMGDAVHAPNPGNVERGWIANCIRNWQSQTQVVFVRGNHDRGIEADFGVSTVMDWKLEEFLCIHGDGPIPKPASGEIVVLGHFHPAISVEDASGVRQRMPVFLSGPQVLVLPAFSPFAAGHDVIRHFPEELLAFGHPIEFHVTVTTGRRTVELGSLSKVRLPASGSRPAAFRKDR